MFKLQLLAASVFGAAVFSSTLVPTVMAQTVGSAANLSSDLTIQSASPLFSGRNPAGSRKIYEYSFKQLGVVEPIQMRGIDAIYSVPFSIPGDEVVTDLKVKLDFSFSPSLLTQLSHLKVMLNGETAQTIALPKEESGGRLVREVSIDPRLISDFNKLNLQFVGHYTLDCEDPFHSSLWLNVSNQSSIHLTVSPLPVVNDLALLPFPFVDKRDSRQLQRPFVFSANPSPGILEAAGIVASWLGDVASYRGAYFPAHLNQLPDDNVVLFATAEDRPEGLVNLPPIDGPTLSVAPHPVNSQYKILYVLGRNAAELKIAATALGLGRVGLGGQTVHKADIADLKKRIPYDAPRWLPSHRPVKFGEIVTTDELNTRGLAPDLLRLNLKTPPDLFGWRSSGASINLKYRYTPRPKPDKSNLNILLNNKFINSYPLLPYAGLSGGDAVFSQWIGKLEPDLTVPVMKRFDVPVNQLLPRSQLQFHFSFDYPKEGACRDVVLDNVRAAIDPDSDLDISKLPKYLKMPNLSAFANTGFPFTRLADLSETVVVLPEKYGAGDIGAYLTLMGRMGESTGLPVYGVSVTKPADVGQYSSKDILLLGGPSTQVLYKEWAKHMPFASDAGTRIFSLSDWKHKLIPWYDLPKQKESTVARLSAETLAKDALIFGFESPLKGGRSVVALTSDGNVHQTDVLTALVDVDVVAKIQGAVSVIRGKEIDAFEVADSYHVGSLPPIMALQWALANNSWVAGLVIIFITILLAGMLYALLRRQANIRLKIKSKS